MLSRASLTMLSAISIASILRYPNFNANSVSVYDLSLGPHGTWTHEIAGVGENPHAMALSPDGSLLAVASFVGRLSGDRVGSQIAFIDTSTLEIVGWLSND